MTAGYPVALPPVNHTAPVPRRIRATLAGKTVLDTTSALYVWESSHYPQYYIPLADIDSTVLVDEQHQQKLSRGTARRHALRVGEIVRPAAVRIYGDDATVEGVAGRARFEWDSLDAWFEEDGSAVGSVDISYEGRGPSGRMSLCRRGFLRSSSGTSSRSLAAVI